MRLYSVLSRLWLAPRSHGRTCRRIFSPPLIFSVLAILTNVSPPAYAAYASLISDPADESSLGITKTPVIFIHGWGGKDSKAYFSNLRTYLLMNSLKNNYKPYLFSYSSNIDPVAVIAHRFRDQIAANSDLKGRKAIIIAHSMGGLVARSYMQDYGGQESVAKLITLATPHHGTPIANLDANRAIGSAWLGMIKTLELVIWPNKDIFSCSLCVGNPEFPNRSDLRADNWHEPQWGESLYFGKEMNFWLRRLNGEPGIPASLDSDKKIVAYYGILANNEFSVALVNQPFNLFVGIAREALDLNRYVVYRILGVLLEKMIQKDNSLLISSSIANYVNNDGVVPKKSGEFFGHTLQRPAIECIGFDHDQMKNGFTGEVCANNLSLFESIGRELPWTSWSALNWPYALISGEQNTFQWSLNDLGAASGTASAEFRFSDRGDPADPAVCSAATQPSCIIPATETSPGIFSATLTAPTVADSKRYTLRAKVTTKWGLDVWTVQTPITVNPAAGPVVSVPPGIIDLGSVALGAAREKAIEIRNSGQNTLTGSVSVPAGFTIVRGGTFSVASGGSSTAVIRFTPVSAAAYSGSLTVTSNGGTSVRTISGTGVSAVTANLPNPTTNSATNTSQTSATLNANVAANGSATDVWFEWGTTAAYGSRTRSQDIGTSSNGVAVADALTGLAPGQTYHYRAVAKNSIGTKAGADQAFATSAPAASPTICHSGRVEFTVPYLSSNTSSQTMTLSNCGAGTLSYSILPDDAWISVSPSNGTSTGEQDTLTVTVDLANRRPGKYVAVMNVSAPGATNTPQVVPVYLHVLEPAPAKDGRPFAYPFEIGNTGYDVHTDLLGDVYVSGGSSINGLAKYDAQGSLIWARLLSDGSSTKFALDSSGNSYFPYREPVSGSKVGFVKYSSAWAKSFSPFYEGSLETQLFDLKTDSAGNIYAAGMESVLENQRARHHTLLLKFAPNGTILWSRRHRNETEFVEAGLTGQRVAVDSAGNVYVGALEQRSGDEAVQAPASRGWIGKYSPAGVLLWEQTLDYGPELAVDINDNLYAATSFARSGQGINILLRKYSSAGSVLWTQEYNDPRNGDDSAKNLTTDASGNVYVVGTEYYQGSLDGGNKTLLLKFDPTGNLVFRRTLGSGNNGTPGGTTHDVAYGVSVGANGDIYAAAYVTWLDSTGQRVWALHYGPDGSLKNYSPPEGIGPLRGIALGVSSITWTWSDVAQNETGYKTMSHTAVQTSGILAANATSWTMTGLAANSAHSAYVYAFNDDGITSAGPMEACTLPDVPGTISVTGRSAFRTTLSWGPGSNPAGTNYELFASTVDAPSSVPSTRVDGSTTGAVTGLMPNTSYYFRVSALNCADQPGQFAASASTVTLGIPAGVVTSTVSVFGTTILASDNRTALTLDAGAPYDSNIFVSRDPLTTPIHVSSADIVTANMFLPSRQAILHSSIREFVLNMGGGVYEGPLSGRLVLPYDDADNDGIVDGSVPPAKPEQLSIYTITNNRWAQVPGQLIVDKTSKTVSVPIAHLSVYAILASVAAADCDGARAFPIPWKPGSGDRFDSANVAGCGRGIIFEKLTSQATIRIYNVVGDLIRELPVSDEDSGCKAWDGKNDAGLDVASGVYVALLKCSSGKKTLKMMIER